MRTIRRFAALLLACAGTFLAAGAAATAQDYPNKPVTVIVPYAAGGPTDTLARQLAPKLEARLGQTFVVENVSGGGATIGTGRVARAAPDGHMLLLHNLQITANISLYGKLPFDTEKDLTGVVFINKNPLILIGKKGLPPNTFAELLPWMKSNTAKMAHPGIGSTGHLTTALLEQAAGVKFDHIPYRGAAPALQDILAGHVDLFLPTPQQVLEIIKGGVVKAYGVTSKGRFEQFPDLPSISDELNNPKLDVVYWQALFAPAGTPRPILEKLNAAVQEAMEDPAILKAWAAAGVEGYPKDQRSIEAAQRLFKAEIQRWSDVVRENKIEAQLQ